MALNNIVFNLGQGGLGRPLPGQDYISGLVFYCANGVLPSGFSTTNRIKQFFSINDAINAGISNSNADATAATGTYQVTNMGNNGDSINITVNGMFGNAWNLGTYVKSATETSPTLVAAAIAAIINSGTNTHGFSAVAVTGTITITAPKYFGIFLNTGTPIVVTLSAGAVLAGTLTQFSGGVASLQAQWYYHINRFFIQNPAATVLVGFFAVPGTYNFNEVTTMQNFASGTIRQIGVYKDGSPLAANGADLTALDIICKANATAKAPLIGILGADISGTSNLATLYDNSQLQANTASVDISQDGAAQGATLFLAYGKSITGLGAVLGTISLAKVSEDIAWPSKFNVSDGTEFAVIAFANGQLNTNAAITDALRTQLQNQRYIFLRFFIGYAGSYYNEDVSAIAASSDYCFIRNNRTIQKATRGIYASMVPALNSPIVLNADGTLTNTSAAYFENLAEVNLQQMVRDGELSAFSVVINPSQNVLSTGVLTITVNLLPIGAANNIVVNIGFNISIT